MMIIIMLMMMINYILHTHNNLQKSLLIKKLNSNINIGWLIGRALVVYFVGRSTLQLVIIVISIIF